MNSINLLTQDGSRHVTYKGKSIEVFHWSDDYAFTKARAYADELRLLSKEEFMKLYPEFFL